MACEILCGLIGSIRINHCSPTIDTSAISSGRTNKWLKATKGASFCAFFFPFPHHVRLMLLFALCIIVSLELLSMHHKTSYIHLSSLFFCLFFLPLFNMFVHFSLTTAHSSNNVYVGKQPVAWKEYFAEYFSKELMESMDRDTGHVI